MKYLSALVTQGSGVMGNLVVEKNGVIRTRKIPANPNTPAQSAARARITSFATSWRDFLSDAQRLAWNAYATTVSRTDALGKPVKLSGIDLYVAANAVDTLGGVGPFAAAPTTDGALLLPAVESVVADDSANTITFTFADVVGSSTHVNLSLSPAPVSPGRASYNGPFRLTQNQPGTGATTVVFTGFAGLTGEKFGWQLQAYDDEGRLARKQSGLTTVVA